MEEGGTGTNSDYSNWHRQVSTSLVVQYTASTASAFWKPRNMQLASSRCCKPVVAMATWDGVIFHYLHVITIMSVRHVHDGTSCHAKSLCRWADEFTWICTPSFDMFWWLAPPTVQLRSYSQRTNSSINEIGKRNITIDPYSQGLLNKHSLWSVLISWTLTPPTV